MDTLTQKMTRKLFVSMISFTLALPIFVQSDDIYYTSLPYDKTEGLELTAIDEMGIETKIFQKNSLWIRDCPFQKLPIQTFFSVDSILSRGKSTFQDYEIVNTNPFGKVLFI